MKWPVIVLILVVLALFGIGIAFDAILAPIIYLGIISIGVSLGAVLELILSRKNRKWLFRPFYYGSLWKNREMNLQDVISKGRKYNGI